MAGNAAIGALRVSLGLDSAQFEDGLKRSQTKLDGFGRQVQSSGANIGAALNRVFDDSRLKVLNSGVARIGLFGGALEELGAAGITAAAGIAAVAVAVESAKGAAEWAEALNNEASKLHVSLSALQELDFAATFAGLNTSQAAADLDRLNDILGQLQEGEPRAKILLREIGFTPAQIASFKNVNDFLPAIAERLGKLGSAAEQAHVLERLGIQDLQPLLAKGSAGLDDIKDKFDEIGGAIDGDLIVKAAAAQEQMKTATAEIGRAWKELGVSVAPVFADLEAAMARIVAGAATVAEKIGSVVQSNQSKRNLLDLQAAQNALATAKTPQERADAQAELDRLHAAMTAPTTPSAQPSTPPARANGGSGAAAAAASSAAASQQAIDRAVQAELAAHKALTTDIVEQADLAKSEIDAQTKTANDKLQAQLSQGKITGYAAALALEMNNAAASEKKALIDRETAEKLEQQALAQRQTIAGYTEQWLSAMASLAPTAEAQAKLELDALATRQKAEADALKVDLAQQVTDGKKTAAEAALDVAMQGQVQAAQTIAAMRQADVAVAQEANQAAEAALELQIDTLKSRQDAAETDAARTQIGLQLLALEQQLERLKLQEVTVANGATQAQEDIAKARLAQLGEVQTNEKKAALRAITSFESASQSFDGLAAAFQNENWSGLPKALDQARSVVETAFGPNGTVTDKFNAIAAGAEALGKSIGGAAGSAISRAASFAEAGSQFGPEAAVAAAAASVLGSLLSGNRVIGQVHLAAQDQQALQGVGTVLGSLKEQSSSIANSLSVAAAAQSTELDYSNQQVEYLKEISDGIGNLSAAIGRSISLGGAFDTSKLGLGSKSSTSLGGAGLLLGLLGGLSTSNTTTSLIDQGINLGSGSLSSYANGTFNGNTYNDLQSVKQKSSLFGLVKSTTTTNSEDTAALASEVTSTVAQVVKSLEGGVLQAAGQIGLDGAQSVLDSFQVNLGRISLQGLSSDQITAQLNAMFSDLGDQLANAVAPQFAALQQSGEGMLQTLERLATEYTAVDDGLSLVGTAFKTVGADSVVARDGLIQASGGLDNFLSQAAYFNQNFLTPAEQLSSASAILTKDWGGLADQMKALGVSVPTTKEQFTALVDSLDTSTTAGATLYAGLMNLAPEFIKVDGLTQSLNSTLLQTAADNVTAARDALNDAYQTEASRLQGVQQQMQGFADSLTQLAGTLSQAGLSASQSYAVLSAQLTSTGAAARLGDPNALGSLAGVIQSFLPVAQSNAKTQLEFNKDQARARVAAEAAAATATRQASIAQQQLDALTQELTALGVLNTSVLSIADAIAVLGSALAAQIAVVTSANGGTPRGLGDAAQNAGVNAALAVAIPNFKGDFGGGNFQNFITSGAATASDRSTASGILNAFGEGNRVQGFATGGSFQVGGSGGIDTMLTKMRTTPGEYVSVSHDDPMSTVAELRFEVAGMRSELLQLGLQTESHTYDSLKLMKRWDANGLYVRGPSPDDPITTAVA